MCLSIISMDPCIAETDMTVFKILRFDIHLGDTSESVTDKSVSVFTPFRDVPVVPGKYKAEEPTGFKIYSDDCFELGKGAIHAYTNIHMAIAESICNYSSYQTKYMNIMYGHPTEWPYKEIHFSYLLKTAVQKACEFGKWYLNTYPDFGIGYPFIYGYPLLETVSFSHVIPVVIPAGTEYWPGIYLSHNEIAAREIIYPE